MDPIVIRKVLGSITIYEITEEELELLSKGNISSLYLNFSLPLLSASIAFLIAIYQTKIESQRVFIVFLAAAIIFGLAGIILFFIWKYKRKAKGSLVKKIKQREPVKETIQIEK